MPLKFDLIDNSLKPNNNHLNIYLQWINQLKKEPTINSYSKVISFNDRKVNPKNSLKINHTCFNILDHYEENIKSCRLVLLMRFSHPTIIQECIQLLNSENNDINNTYATIINNKYTKIAPSLKYPLKGSVDYYFLPELFLYIVKWIGNDENITIKFN